MRTVTLSLKCDYTDEELAEKRDQLVALIMQEGETENRKSETAKAFKEELEQIHGTRNRIALQIKARGENREIKCAVEFHKPTVGLKRIVRLDSGEFVKDEVMTDSERQDNLFPEIEEIQKAFDAPDQRPENRPDVL